MMQEKLKRINEIMNILFQNHRMKPFEDELEFILEEVYEPDENPELYQLFQEAMQMLSDDEVLALEYFKQCPIGFFGAITYAQEIINQADEFYPKLSEIWKERCPKERSKLRASVLENLAISHTLQKQKKV